MDNSVSIDIKVPSWNMCYGIRNNHIYKKSAAQDFQDIVGLSYRGELFEGAVRVEITFGRCPLIDIDNAAKLTLDSLEGRAYNNDRQVEELHLKRYKCTKGEDYLCIKIIPII